MKVAGLHIPNATFTKISEIGVYKNSNTKRLRILEMVVGLLRRSFSLGGRETSRKWAYN